MRIVLIHFSALIAFFTYLQMCDGAIQCYKCTLTRPPLYSNETTRLCAEFDYSDKFIVDCPYSTFCMKNSFSAKIPGPINASERDCANQKYVTQNFQNGIWQPAIYIEEPYKEGCSVIDDKGIRTSTTEHCYCKGDLCNTSLIIHKINFLNFLITAVILSINYL